ncbi:MAG: recombinase family protein [Fusobacterium sp.]|uniref:recombinase family protein n=1 Tax=Fusobacterium sp. TaxID=68766 RepID=UPI002A753517|nr:recombinase family protein [Fusobacterium sp.]MDY3060084.1 recombinase family protein [Fusobacterium sp.]
MKVYGYVRVSTEKQVITRQVENILKEYEHARIYSENFTGTTNNRPEWNKLKKIVETGDTIVFDSVSRMSRNAAEGIEEYFNFLDTGINLVFLKERYINSDVYLEQLKSNTNISSNDNDLDKTVMAGIREYLKILAQKQIQIAFDQAEKEVKDLQERTKEGLRVARAKGNIGGRKVGSIIETKKAKEMKEKILKLSKEFNGNLKDIEVIDILKISNNTYYKYKKELKFKIFN